MERDARSDPVIFGKTQQIVAAIFGPLRICSFAGYLLLWIGYAVREVELGQRDAKRRGLLPLTLRRKEDAVGRPTSYPPTASKRDQMVRFTVSRDERQTIERAAQEHQRTPSEYARMVLLGHLPGPAQRESLTFARNPFGRSLS